MDSQQLRRVPHSHCLPWPFVAPPLLGERLSPHHWAADKNARPRFPRVSSEITSADKAAPLNPDCRLKVESLPRPWARLFAENPSGAKPAPLLRPALRAPGIAPI